MLYTFKSRAASDLILLEADGRHLLTLIGKDPDIDKGVITAAQIPAAVAALKAAVVKEEARVKPKSASHDEDEANEEGEEAAEVVALRQRVVPFVEWLERSEADGHDVMW